MSIIKKFSTGPIRAVDFQRFAIAAGDLNPIYFDANAARKAGYLGIVAPPNYVTAVQSWAAGPFDNDMRPDGFAKNYLSLEILDKKVMGGGEELEFFEPIYDGDVLMATVRLVESYNKKTSSNKDIFVTQIETVYVNQRGQQVLVCNTTILFSD